ncbi:hypothetical protein Q5752_006051 [Cryptotrichosporon argae]
MAFLNTPSQRETQQQQASRCLPSALDLPAGLIQLNLSLSTFPAAPRPASTLPALALPLASMTAEFDWQSFLNVGEMPTVGDSSAEATLPASPAFTSSPRSTESEQSEALDVPDFPSPSFDFNLNLPLIAHDPADIYSALAVVAPAPDNRGMTDPTMVGTFGLNFADFGELAGLGPNAISQLGLDDLFASIPAAQPEPVMPAANNSLAQAVANMDWALLTASPVGVSPLSLSLSPPASPPLESLKRKISDASDISVPVKRPRGRPPKSASVIGPLVSSHKRPYNRQPRSSLTKTPSPLIAVHDALSDDDLDGSESEVDSSVKLTVSGKPSTARPKSVVPEKYMKNGQAQEITGMTVEQINTFPNWTALMAAVDDAHRVQTKEFGKMIRDNRRKAKDAAKKSREERKAKVEGLESQIAGLEAKLDVFRVFAQALSARGLQLPKDVEALI